MSNAISPLLEVPSSDSFIVLYNQVQAMSAFLKTFSVAYNEHVHYHLGNPGPSYDKVKVSSGPTDPDHLV
jgi:hypothetical protein